MKLTIDLKTELTKRGRTLYWLAKETGIQYDAINRLANGKTTGVKLETLEKICEALECGPCDVIVESKSAKKSRKH